MGNLFTKLTNSPPKQQPPQPQQQPQPAASEDLQKKQSAETVAAAAAVPAATEYVEPIVADDVIEPVETGAVLMAEKTPDAAVEESSFETVHMPTASETLPSVPDIQSEPTPGVDKANDDTSNEIQTSAEPVDVVEQKVEDQPMQSGSLSTTDADISDKLEELNLCDAAPTEDHHHDNEQQQQQQTVGEDAQVENKELVEVATDDVNRSGTEDVIEPTVTVNEFLLETASETLPSVPDVQSEEEPTPGVDKTSDDTSNEFQTSADPVDLEHHVGDDDSSACLSSEAGVMSCDVTETEQKVQDQQQSPSDADLGESTEDHHHDNEQQQQPDVVTSSVCDDQCHVDEQSAVVTSQSEADEQIIDVSIDAGGDVIERQEGNC